MRAALLFAALLFGLPATAEEKSFLRSRFSTSYVSVAGEITGGNGQASIPGGARTYIPSQLLGRLTIGSYYFWGRADLYFSVDLFRLSLGDSVVKQAYTTGIISGVHFYPWRLEDGGFRPFVGAAWAPHDYRQTNANGEGVRDIVHRVPLDAGVTWLKGAFAIELGLRVMLFNYSTYYVSRTESGPLWMPPLSGWLGVKYAIGTAPDAAQVSYSERFAKRFRWATNESWPNSLGLALGLGGAFPLTSSSWMIQEHPFLGTRPNGTVFPDLGITYDIAPLRGVINVGYRPMQQTTEAYGFRQELTRHALSLEYDQYLFEFHGFYPFVGAFMTYNALRVRETDNGQLVQQNALDRFAPGVALGFDLLPSSLQWLVLRVNARYTIGLNIGMPVGKIWFDHLEIDYLQLVFYPARFWAKQKEKS